MTPRRGELAELAHGLQRRRTGTATGLAGALQIALLDEANQGRPYRLIWDHPFDVLHDLNHLRICPVRGYRDLSGWLDNGTFIILCQAIQVVDEIRAQGHQVRVIAARAAPRSDNNGMLWMGLSG
jgi:hypothetical protein